MKKLLFVLILMAIAGALTAQHTVTGTVRDASNGEPIPGVNILEQSTNKGTITGVNGQYKLSVSSAQTVLKYSFMGYKSQTVEVNGREKIDVSLKLKSQVVDEVVITAFGIKREKKELGYSVTDIKSEELTKVRETNVINSIAGKVAGINISQTAGGAGSSSRVVIRGNSSIQGQNQPLIVVDGVPIDNSNHQQPTWLGGIDYGSGISDINPENIESMSVLKGPNAAALYGSRAANGVIIIETKKGSKQQGIGISFSSNTQVNLPYLLLDLQNKYGMGSQGNIPLQKLTPEEQERYGTDSLPYTHHFGSWGPNMNEYDQDVLHWYGEVGKLEPHPNNLQNYFKKGVTTTNTLSMEGGGDKSTFRLSYTNLYNKGIKPNSEYKRNNFIFRGALDLTSKLKAEAKVNYIREDAFNRVGMADARTGMRNFIWMPRNISMDMLKTHMEGEDGYEQNWYADDPWHQNPYWVSFKNTNNDNKDRIIGQTSLNYQIFDWLNLQLRASTDFYKSRRYKRKASYSLAEPTGRYSETWIAVKENNYDFLFTGQHSLGENFGLSYNFGGNRFDSYVDISSGSITGFAVPNFFTLNNVKDPLNRSVGTTVKEKRINSLYGTTKFSFRDYLFLDITGRNDWSSTLPADNNSYFYPSASLSFALTEAFNISNDILTFAKLRASWAKVGNDTEPYKLDANYIAGNYGSYPTNYLESQLPVSNLKPETTESYELGGDFRLLKNRIGIDATVYKQSTYNQIIDAEISKTSGFDVALINAGEIENKGIEVLFRVTPVKSANMRWEASFNFAKNLSNVIELAEDIETYTITRSSQISIRARPGYAYGNIVGASIKRWYNYNADSTEILDHANNGKPLITSEGRYATGERKILGNITPDWSGGFSTDFTYKNLTVGLNFLIQMGGDIFSKTNKYGHDNGQFKATLEGRESWYNATEEEKIAGEAGYVADGVMSDGTVNTTGINPQEYFHQRKWGGIAELDVYDASFAKLKRAYITYSLPQKLLAELPITSASFSLTGNNLWLIYSGVPNIDPEASSFSSGSNALGQEYAPMPSTRDIGFNLNIKF